jgi:hypothetical protein
VQQRTARAVVALVVVLAVVALGTAFAVDRLGGDDDAARTSASPTLKPAAASTTTGARPPTTARGPTSPSSPTAPATTATSATSGASGSDGTAGAADVGDPYFPGLGNGGYDVDDYHLALSYDPGTDRLEGTATITARATQALDSFHLDLTGMTVGDVTVDGREAAHTREGDELVVEAPRRIGSGTRFTTVVAYGGVPENDAIAVLGEEGGWITTDEGAFTLDEPDGAHSWFASP